MSEPEFSASFQAVLNYLDSKKFDYTPCPGEHRVTFAMSGKNAIFRFTACITHDGDYLQVTAAYPFTVRDERLRPSVAELITRANYGMPVGKLEMDMKDGEVRFHVTHVIGETGLTEGMIERHFMTAYFTSDRYFPAFMQHLHAGYTPEDAVFHAEIDLHTELAEEPPKQGKPKPKASTSGPRLSAGDPKAGRPAKTTRRRKSGQKNDQGELPI